jgi:hypothetical protein
MSPITDAKILNASFALALAPPSCDYAQAMDLDAVRR